ncbi:MAG: preprotein translocase subunit YajC, partial [Gemmataceae bacterium]
MSPLFMLFAQGDAPAPQRNPLDNIFLLMPVLALLFYIIVLRPMGKRREQEEAERNALQKDDDILTIGGIYGTVVSVSTDKDKDEVVVKISDNTRVKMTRNAVHRNLSHEARLKAKSAEKKDPPKTESQAPAGQIR